MGCMGSKSSSVDASSVRRVAPDQTARRRTKEAIAMSVQDIYKVYRFNPKAIGTHSLADSFALMRYD